MTTTLLDQAMTAIRDSAEQFDNEEGHAYCVFCGATNSNAHLLPGAEPLKHLEDCVYLGALAHFAAPASPATPSEERMRSSEPKVGSDAVGEEMSAEWAGGRCKDCQVWEHHHDTRGRQWTTCEAAAWLEYHSPIAEKGLAVYAHAADDHGLDAGIKTGPMFGCILFRPITPKVDHA